MPGCVQARAGLVSVCGVRDGLVVVRVASHALGEGGGVAAARAAAQFGSRACRRGIDSPSAGLRRGSPRRVLGDGARHKMCSRSGLFFHVQYIERTQSIITAWLDAHYATAVDK